MTRTIRARDHTDLGALIASAKCLDMSIELRLTGTDDLVQIPAANLPDTCHATYEREIVRN